MKVRENVPCAFRLGELHDPSSAVTVWVELSLFVHFSVVPTEIRIGSGEKLNPEIWASVTSAAPAGTAGRSTAVAARLAEPSITKNLVVVRMPVLRTTGRHGSLLHRDFR